MIHRAIAFTAALGAALGAADAAHAASLIRFVADGSLSVAVAEIDTFYSPDAGLLSGDDAGGFASVLVEFDEDGMLAPVGSEVALFADPFLDGDALDAVIGDGVIRFLLSVVPGSDAGWGAFAIATLSFAPGSFTAAEALTTSALATGSLIAALTVESATPIPLPSALPLALAGLGALVAVGRRRR